MNVCKLPAMAPPKEKRAAELEALLNAALVRRDACADNCNQGWTICMAFETFSNKNWDYW